MRLLSISQLSVVESRGNLLCVCLTVWKPFWIFENRKPHHVLVEVGGDLIQYKIQRFSRLWKLMRPSVRYLVSDITLARNQILDNIIATIALVVYISISAHLSSFASTDLVTVAAVILSVHLHIY